MACLTVKALSEVRDLMLVSIDYILKKLPLGHKKRFTPVNPHSHLISKYLTGNNIYTMWSSGKPFTV